MTNFRSVNRATEYLLPSSVDEWLSQLHLARFVVESGSASHRPALLLYGHTIKMFSSQALERVTYDSVTLRFIAGNEHPDHDTIAALRKRSLGRLEFLFVDVLKLTRTMGMFKLGTRALDGTNIHANAGRHSALSHAHAQKIEKQPKKEEGGWCRSYGFWIFKSEIRNSGTIFR